MTLLDKTLLRATCYPPRLQMRPFDLKIDKPNKTTIAAIEEGRQIASDPTVRGYHNIDDLKAALEV